jgi:Flp pilus assembly pilin Flp
MKTLTSRFLREETRVTGIELLIAVVIIGAVTAVGTNLELVFNTISSALSSALG